MNKEKEVISLIETYIKKGNANIELFTINLITNLRKLISNEELKAIIEKRLLQKKIYFIRHAEAEHNVLERKYKGDFSKCNIYDPMLTRLGAEQTKFTIEKLKKENINFEIIYVSPLLRTLQTFFLIQNYLNKNSPVFITDFVREVLSYCDKNKGHTLSVLKKELKSEKLNFDYMTKEFWWNDFGKNKGDELETQLFFNIRLRIFVLWLIFRPEKNILIISHSHVFVALQNKGIYNADLARMNNQILFQKTMELIYLEIIEYKPKKANGNKSKKNNVNKIRKK